MFETYTETEIPFGKKYEEVGIKVWGFVERRIHSHWFHVTCEAIDSERKEYTPNLFYSDVKQLLALNEHNKTSVNILTVEIVTPCHMNGSDHWKMEPLKELWLAWSPKPKNSYTHIFILENGKRYVEPDIGTSENKLTDRQLLLKL